MQRAEPLTMKHPYTLATDGEAVCCYGECLDPATVSVLRNSGEPWRVSTEPAGHMDANRQWVKHAHVFCAAHGNEVRDLRNRPGRPA